MFSVNLLLLLLVIVSGGGVLYKIFVLKADAIEKAAAGIVAAMTYFYHFGFTSFISRNRRGEERISLIERNLLNISQLLRTNLLGYTLMTITVYLIVIDKLGERDYKADRFIYYSAILLGVLIAAMLIGKVPRIRDLKLYAYITFGVNFVHLARLILYYVLLRLPTPRPWEEVYPGKSDLICFSLYFLADILICGIVAAICFYMLNKNWDSEPKPTAAIINT